MQSPWLDLLTLSQTEDKLSVQLKSKVLLGFCCCKGSMQIKPPLFSGSRATQKLTSQLPINPELAHFVSAALL
jgi:hypothetical protein